MSASKYQLSYLVILDKTPLVCCCCWQYCFWSNFELQHRGKLQEEVEEEQVLCQSGEEGGGTAFRSSLSSPPPSSLSSPSLSPPSLSSSLLSSPSSFHLHYLGLFHAIWLPERDCQKIKNRDSLISCWKQFSDIFPSERRFSKWNLTFSNQRWPFNTLSSTSGLPVAGIHCLKSEHCGSFATKQTAAAAASNSWAQAAAAGSNWDPMWRWLPPGTVICSQVPQPTFWTFESSGEPD